MPYHNSSNTRFSKRSRSCRKYKKWKWIKRLDRTMSSTFTWLDLKITANNLKVILVIIQTKEWVGGVFQCIKSKSMKMAYTKVIFRVKMGQFLPTMSRETPFLLRKTFIVIIWLSIAQSKAGIDLTQLYHLFSVVFDWMILIYCFIIYLYSYQWVKRFLVFCSF